MNLSLMNDDQYANFAAQLAVVTISFCCCYGGLAYASQQPLNRWCFVTLGQEGNVNARDARPNVT